MADLAAVSPAGDRIVTLLGARMAVAALLVHFRRAAAEAWHFIVAFCAFAALRHIRGAMRVVALIARDSLVHVEVVLERFRRVVACVHAVSRFPAATGRH